MNTGYGGYSDLVTLRSFYCWRRLAYSSTVMNDHSALTAQRLSGRLAPYRDEVAEGHGLTKWGDTVMRKNILMWFSSYLIFGVVFTAAHCQPDVASSVSPQGDIR
jgi:hypothetical protein